MLKVFVWTASIIIFIISICLSLFSDLLSSNFHSSKINLYDLDTNWNTSPIMAIEFSDSPCKNSEIFINNGFPIKKKEDNLKYHLKRILYSF